MRVCLSAKEAGQFSMMLQAANLGDSRNIETIRMHVGVTTTVQEEGLRTYLFTYAPFYDTLSLSTLSGMFDLPEQKVTALVSKMIHHEELAAALAPENARKWTMDNSRAMLMRLVHLLRDKGFVSYAGDALNDTEFRCERRLRNGKQKERARDE